MKRIEKIKNFFKYRKELWSQLNSLLYTKQVENKLKSFNIQKLPEVSVSEFFAFYGNPDLNLAVVSDFSDGISPINDYYFLCRIAKVLKTKTYFEIGTWLGLSARNIADAMGAGTQIFSLDIPFDHPEIEIFKIPKEIFGHYSKDYPNVHFLKSDSKEFDFSKYYGTADFVFIDGNHSAEYVESDSRNGLKLLKNDDSVIAWHDYTVLGEVNKEVLCGILKAVPQSEHKHLYHLQQSNMAIFSKSFDFKERETPKWEIPENIYKLDINILKK
ncbi:MAG: class I SAM-dependent methyltransferase [Chlorobi bacterium]|nr:class I SAM-dependent methyltransferase [Chlorobiota bacterium]MCI0714848.1 class I SAM-dependent methyltransferase [Chlorobiota bacterium]